MLTKETLAEWRQNPTTREVFKHFRGVIRGLEEQIGCGSTLNHSSAEETLANTARDIGIITGIKSVIEWGTAEEDEE